MSSFELSGEQVPKPPFHDRDDSSQEEEPDSPARRPNADSRAFADGTGVEAEVDEVFNVFAEPHLSHELVLVAVHACGIPHMSEDILQTVGQLEGINVAQSVLSVAVYNEFGKSEDLSAEVKSVTEPRLLSFFCGESLDRLEHEVVVEMQVVEVSPVDDQVQHVEALSAQLEACLDPVDLGLLKEFRRSEGFEETLLVDSFRLPLVERVQDDKAKLAKKISKYLENGNR